MSEQTAFRIRQENAARYLALKMHQRQQRVENISAFIAFSCGGLLVASVAVKFIFLLVGV